MAASGHSPEAEKAALLGAGTSLNRLFKDNEVAQRLVQTQVDLYHKEKLAKWSSARFVNSLLWSVAVLDVNTRWQVLSHIILVLDKLTVEPDAYENILLTLQTYLHDIFTGIPDSKVAPTTNHYLSSAIIDTALQLQNFEYTLKLVELLYNLTYPNGDDDHPAVKALNKVVVALRENKSLAPDERCYLLLTYGRLAIQGETYPRDWEVQAKRHINMTSPTAGTGAGIPQAGSLLITEMLSRKFALGLLTTGCDLDELMQQPVPPDMLTQDGGGVIPNPIVSAVLARLQQDWQLFLHGTAICTGNTYQTLPQQTIQALQEHLQNCIDTATSNEPILYWQLFNLMLMLFPADTLMRLNLATLLHGTDQVVGHTGETRDKLTTCAYILDISITLLQLANEFAKLVTNGITRVSDNRHDGAQLTAILNEMRGSFEAFETKLDSIMQNVAESFFAAFPSADVPDSPPGSACATPAKATVAVETDDSAASPTIALRAKAKKAFATFLNSVINTFNQYYHDYQAEALCYMPAECREDFFSLSFPEGASPLDPETPTLVGIRAKADGDKPDEIIYVIQQPGGSTTTKTPATLRRQLHFSATPASPASRPSMTPGKATPMAPRNLDVDLAAADQRTLAPALSLAALTGLTPLYPPPESPAGTTHCATPIPSPGSAQATATKVCEAIVGGGTTGTGADGTAHIDGSGGE